MAISDNYVPLKQIGNGVTTQFSALWQILSAAYIRVYLEDVLTGVQTLVTQGGGPTQYTVTFNSSGFVVTFNTAPTSAYYVVIGRQVALDQGVPYRTSSGFQGFVTEGSFDKLTAMVQDQSDQIDRALKFPLGSTANGALPVPLMGYALVWGDNLGTLVNGPSVGDIAGAAAAAATAVAAAATAQATVPIAASAAGWAYMFSTGVAATDPGAGFLKFNNAALASATALYISETTSAVQAIQAEIASWAASGSTVKSKLRLIKQSNPTIYVEYGVTAVTDNGAWDTVAVTYIGGNGVIANGDALVVQPFRTGDIGNTGAAGPTGADANRNVLLNGAFAINQRRANGTALTGAGTYAYTADRWCLFSSTAATSVINSGSTLAGLPNFIRLQRTNGQSDTTNRFLLQPLTTANSLKLAGRQVVLSFYARTGANWSGVLSSTVATGTGTDQAPSGVGAGSWSGFAQPASGTQATTQGQGWTRYFITGTIAANATQVALQSTEHAWVRRALPTMLISPGCS